MTSQFAPIRGPKHKEIEGILRRWANEAQHKILTAYYGKGGWEGWAQVEIEYALKKYYGTRAINGTGVHIQREPHSYLYDATQRADVVVRYYDDHPKRSPAGYRIAAWTTIIELKCESYENSESFKNGVEADITKIQAELTPEYFPEEEDAVEALVIAICVSPEARTALSDMGINESSENFSPLLGIKVDGSEGSFTIFLYNPRPEGRY
jgi:hypothetical protein